MLTETSVEGGDVSKQTWNFCKLEVTADVKVRSLELFLEGARERRVRLLRVQTNMVAICCVS